MLDRLATAVHDPRAPTTNASSRCTRATSGFRSDATARVIARRVPGDSHVRWLVILDRALDPADPGIAAELESAFSQLRALTGLEGSSERKIRACGAIKQKRRASYLDVESRGC